MPNAWHANAGRYHPRFKQAFAADVGRRHAVGFPSGTAPLHLVLAALGAGHGGGLDVAQRLEASDIIVNYNLLPRDTDARHPSGLRIGVQEMTRYGMREAEMQRLAELMAASIKGTAVQQDVNALRAQFPELQYV